MKGKSSTDSYLKLVRLWKEEFSRLYEEKPEELRLLTTSAIPLKSVYSPGDVENLEYEEIGMPGIYPFTRGTAPLQNQLRPFGGTMQFGYGLPEDTRKRMDDIFLKDPAMVHLTISNDLPSCNGYDPDHPLARGKVGQSGVSLCNTEDFKRLLDGLPIDEMRLIFVANVASIVMLALYIVYAERRGIPPEALRGRATNRLYMVCYYAIPGFPPEPSVKLMVELIKYCAHNMPDMDALALDGYGLAESGANAIQELAFLMAIHLLIAERMAEAGLSPDNYASKVGTKLRVDMDFFEEIAKIRAFRRIWAKINRERLGCKDPRSLQARINIHTAGISLTAQQPLNNIIRTTIEAMVGAIAGVDGMHICSYDEACTIPTEEAVTIAMRTRDILSYESGSRSVTDPMGGSYYVEYLTRKIEQGVYKMLEEIDKRGGFLKYWENNWVRGVVEEEAYRWKESVSKKEKIIVGLNKFNTDEEIDVPIFRIDPRVEKTAVARVKAFKKKRDSVGVRSSLDNVREVARNDGELMPALIEAARADATLGEMMDVLRDVYGWRQY